MNAWNILGWALIVLGYMICWTGLPGPLLMALGLGLWWYFGVPFAWPGLEILALVVLVLGGEFAEQAGGFITLRYSGISRKGWWGGILGGVFALPLVLLTLNPLLFLAGLFAGVVIGELSAGRSWAHGVKGGIAFMLGKVGGYVIKVTLATMTTIYVVLRVLLSLL